MGTSTTRIMGLASNLDTESIIQQTLKLTQLKIDSKYRAKTSLVWKQEALTSFKTDITDFRRTYLSSLSSLNMRSSSVYNSTTATTSGANADAVTIKTTLGSSVGTMKIGQIESLAKGASVSSSGKISADNNGFKGDVKLSDMKFGASGEGLTFETVTDEDDVNYGKDVTRLTINGKEFTFTSDTTLDNMMKTINNDADVNATLSYDRLSDSFKLESKTIGSSSTLSFEGEALTKFGRSESNKTEGTMARVKINGEWVESEKNTFEFRGVSITLNRTTGAAEEDTTVTLKRDATEAVKKIKQFVEAYNTLIAKLEGATKERKTSTESTYTPRTDEELAEMTESQITAWNKVAKKGVLYGDSGIQSLTNSLRSALFQSVESAGLSPSQIGLSTGSYFDGTGGQIVLDEEKLTAALEKDPDQVMNAFMGITRNEDDTVNYSKSGLLVKMDNMLNTYVNKSQSITLDSLKDSIKRAQEQIDKMTTKMLAEEEKLYAKYAALETAMSKLNSQSSNFSALLGNS